MTTTLVLGGARSGKSEAAERMAGQAAARTGAAVTYLATGTATDPDMAARIERHRRRRPPGWSTVEVGTDLGGDLPAALDAVVGAALVDSLGTWVAGRDGFVVDASALCAALARRSAPTFVVSEEVGLGVHPSSEAGRLFRDALGALNLAVAEAADRVVLVVAGRVLPLDRPV